ncbi:PREDICTED: uncharacterized protein LOC104816214 [Tarenaya hassleriana]|uniref:uncharacterized protein LOC104816214 n=1 Tax=Tarenaya hassleriana TaxID=28532 RepID=UPI00053C7C72|nr:PREDICTED: uncharacterized protein LOC104816214 [Tarenaya hassleriana]
MHVSTSLTNTIAHFNMSRKACKGVSFSADPEATDEPVFRKHGGFGSSRQDRRRVVVGILNFGLRRSPARRFLRRLEARVAKTLRFISQGRAKTSPSCSSRKVPSSPLPCSSSIYLKRSRSLAESESHRAEAIEDCIEFLNSCSSVPRSNSVSTFRGADYIKEEHHGISPPHPVSFCSSF